MYYSRAGIWTRQLSTTNTKTIAIACTKCSLCEYKMWKKVRSLAFVATLLLTIATTRQSSRRIVAEAVSDGDTDSKGILATLKAQYDDLSPRGKMVTGAAVGFVGSRLALGTVTKVVKWGTGAFIV
jgi:hypothetical protein